MLFLVGALGGLLFLAGYTTEYYRKSTTSNANGAHDISNDPEQFPSPSFWVSLPEKTPYDRDPQKRQEYLLYYKLGYETVWGVTKKCSPSAERSPPHVVRGWQDGATAGFQELQKQLDRATEMVK